MTLDLAARLSSGATFPDGSRLEPADSLFITYEDGVADTIRPRAEAAGADLTRIHVLGGISLPGEAEQPLTLPDDVTAIMEKIRETGARLLVVDPLSAALSGSVDSYKDHDIRRALAPLARLAEDTGAAVIPVRHLTKGSRGSAILQGAGSIGIAGAARVVLAVHRHPDDEESGDRRVLAVAKCNLARLAPTQSYRLISTGECARIQWEGNSTFSADDLAAARGNEDERSQLDDAKDFLESALQNGPRPRVDIVKEAAREAVAVRTLHRAKAALNVISVKGFGTRATWCLPDDSAPSVPRNPNFANSAYSGTAGKDGKGGKDGAEVGQAGDLFEVAPNGVLVAADGSQTMSPERIAAELARRQERRQSRETT